MQSSPPTTRTGDFSFDLPPALIAQQPLEDRTASRLLICDSAQNRIEDRLFVDLPTQLHAGDLLVLNNSRVLKARLAATKPTGGRVELLVEQIVAPDRALCHVRASKRLQAGTQLALSDKLSLRLLERQNTLWLVELVADMDFYQLLEQCGQVPLPPYIDRTATAQDIERYQTVYGQIPGSVAAPTAGLHFDHTTLEALKARGVRIAYLTLHVGAGTFQPVRAQHLKDHVMHAERVEVTQQLCDLIAATKQAGRRVIGVGTTVVRALESAHRGDRVQPLQGTTDIFITPGYRFRCIDLMLSNLHLPESTPMMLVCAFGGYDMMMRSYRHAIDARYRFLSYGDAMLIHPQMDDSHHAI